MNAILDIFAAALNSLWQAALAAALVWAALRWLRPRFNAATRYVIWWAALAIVLILPAGPRALSWWQARGHVAIAPDTRAAVRSVPLDSIPLEAPVVVTVRPDRHPAWPYWILGIWAALCLYRLSQIVRSYFYLRGVKHRASLAPQALPPIARKASLLLSGDVASPMAVGFAHPAVVLPQALAQEITPQELDHVLLHEAAHLARRDDWANLAARMLGAALVLHPVAWFVLREIERERESACDDWVVARTGEARPYAASLARMFELRASRPKGVPGEALAAGIFGGGSRIGERIELLLKRGREFSPQASLARLAGTVAALLCLLGAGSLAPRWIAFAQNTAFEVASVKSNKNNEGPGRASNTRIEPDGISIRWASLLDLICTAYQIPYSRVIAADRRPLPGERYDIDARAGTEESKDQLLLMLQTLLADRFELRLHRESKVQPVYNLVVAKGGLKMTEGVRAPDASCKSPQCLAIDNVEMWVLAATLSGRMGRPVLDRTGLAGGYSGALRLDIMEGLSSSDPELKIKTMDWSSSSIYSDIERQLGLRLEAGTAPVETLVVDHAEKPDAN